MIKKFLKDFLNPIRLKAIKLFQINKLEVQILRKKALRNDSNIADSFLIFCPHKSASTLVSKLLKLSKGDFRTIDYSSYLSLTIKDFGRNYNDHESFFRDNFNELFLREKTIFGPLRKSFAPKLCRKYKKVFFIRDPRDSIVSWFYSMKVSHPVPIEKYGKQRFLNYRKNLSKKTIDEYALSDGLDFFLNTYVGLIDEVNSSINKKLIFKYEDYIDEPIKSLDSILSFMEVKNIPEIIKIVERDIKPKDGKDIFSHRRSGHYGQYNNELKSETVEKLNEKLKKVLDFFGYE